MRNIVALVLVLVVGCTQSSKLENAEKTAVVQEMKELEELKNVVGKFQRGDFEQIEKLYEYSIGENASIAEYANQVLVEELGKDPGTWLRSVCNSIGNTAKLPTLYLEVYPKGKGERLFFSEILSSIKKTSCKCDDLKRRLIEDLEARKNSSSTSK